MELDEQKDLKINEVCCICNRFVSDYVECSECRLAVYCSDSCRNTSTHVCRKDSSSLRLMRTVVTVLSNKLNEHEGFRKAYDNVNKSRSIRRIKTPRLLVILVTEDTKICDILDNIEKYINIATVQEMCEIFKKYNMPFPMDWKKVTGVVLYKDTPGISFGIIGS